VPNLVLWNLKRKEIDGYFADLSITNYHVLACTTSTTKVVLAVPDVPGLGYRTLWVCPRSAEKKPSKHLNPLFRTLLLLNRLPLIKNVAMRKRYSKPPYKIENDSFIVSARSDGTLSILDKQSGLTYFGQNRFLDGGDCGDEYNYSPPDADRITVAHLKHVLITRGPVQQSLELELELSTPLALTLNRKSRSREKIHIPITTTVILTNGVPRIDIHTRIENHARDHRLRVHFPAPFSTITGAHDGHFEVVERKIGAPVIDETWVEHPRPEVPQRAFTSVTDGRTGLTVANRGLTEVEVLENSRGNAEIAVTLLRCVGWLSSDDFSTRKGHAGPFLETPGAQIPGTWTFDYSIIPHAGNWQKAYAQAYAFETPMRLTSTGLHAGTLPVSASFMKILPSSFVISAVKQNEAGDGWLVRGYNITGEAINVTFKPWKPFKKVGQINLAEEKLAMLKADTQGCVTVPVHGHEIISVLFQN